MNFQPMMNRLFLVLFAGILCCSCRKENPAAEINNSKKQAEQIYNQFISYTIKKGAQYCDKSDFEQISCSTLLFKVRFDSSAIYKTVSPGNQTDINKLLGFSDNNATHHEYSARFGWRWSDNSLHLFAYVYNNGQRIFRELGTASFGKDILCEIRVAKDHYIFSLNGTGTSMPRASTTAMAEGYKLFPYFGGDETAPHDITLWIEELQPS